MYARRGFVCLEGRNVRLFDHAAGNARSTAAQGSGLVGVIVAAGMDHDGTALEILDAQIGSMQLGADSALGIGINGGQVALVSVFAGAFVPAGFIGVKVSARSQAGNFFAVFFSRGAGCLLYTSPSPRDCS